MGLFSSVFELAEDVVKIATAPVEVALTITKAVVKPISDIAKEVVDEVKDAVE